MYNKRVPEHGDWSTGSNVVNVNHRIPVELNPAPNERVRLTVDVWEADEGGDDHLGKWTHDLSAATGCGLRENGGIFRSGDFSRISSITAAHQPIVDVNQLSATDMFGASRTSAHRRSAMPPTPQRSGTSTTSPIGGMVCRTSHSTQ
jgi:hypothetical protein